MGGTPSERGVITWGGEVPSLYANGGMKTREGSIFGDLGLNIQFVNRDDMNGQFDAYERGQTKWIRGTFGMVGLGIAKRGLCEPTDMSMCPVMVFQETFSKGDHLAAIEEIKTLADLKSKSGKKVRIALNQDGPHMTLLPEILADAKLALDDVEIVWCEELFGPKGPDGAMRKGLADAAFVITSPGLIELTSGGEMDSVGDGTEQSVLGVHLLTSTRERAFSIADTYWVHPDELKTNPDGVRRFALGYLKAMEQVQALQKQHEKAGGSDEFIALMELTAKVFDLPNAEEAYGLFLDAQFVGHTGNVEFLNPGNDHGFNQFAEKTNKAAELYGYATTEVDFQHVPASFWVHPDFREHLKASIDVQVQSRFDKDALQAELDSMDALTFESRRSHFFRVHYEAGQTTFPLKRYGPKFEEALEMARKYPRSALVITGHADPGATLRDYVVASGLQADEDPQTGQKSRYVYVGSGRGESIDIRNTNQVLAEIGLMDSAQIPGGINPKDTARAAMDVSLERAKNVEVQFVQMLEQQGISYDPNQITVRGMGVTSPLIARPTTVDDMSRNRRVEFNFVRVSGEAFTQQDLDF